ncbi:MAG: ATP-binding cassette domain-containing protein [Ignavibacteriales bacterium]|nr:ATP-binding cassette domain-containing protein [Ignavibacteriales bacterium]
MLKVSNLRKEFASVVAVDGASLEVKRGELFGLLGPNGAGKTTTIRAVLNIIQPDSGEITFDGKPFTREMWNIIGYLPEERGLYRKSKVINTILYFASLKGISGAQAKPLAYHWLDRFGLKEAGTRKVEELSKGNQQKIQLIASILHKPQLLILDEPFSGLDPVNQILLKDILLELRRQNTAIIFSTHQMDQVEKMCDNICLINRGKPVLSGALVDVKSRYGTNSVRLEFDGDGSFLKSLPNIKRADVYQNYAELELVEIQRTGELLGKLDARLNLRKFEIVEPSLNSIFINVVGGVLEPEQPQLPAASVPVSQPMDPRVRKQLLSVAISFVALAVFLVLGVMKPNFGFLPSVIMLVGGLFSTFKYLQAKGQVDRERRSKLQGGSS